MLISGNVSGDEVVGKAAEGLASVSRGSIAAFALSLACAVSIPSVALEYNVEGVVCAELCVEVSEEAFSSA